MQEKLSQEPVADDQLSPFERFKKFTEAILKVPKTEIDALETERVKRPTHMPKK